MKKTTKNGNTELASMPLLPTLCVCENIECPWAFTLQGWIGLDRHGNVNTTVIKLRFQSLLEVIFLAEFILL